MKNKTEARLQFELDEQEEKQWRDCVIADFKMLQDKVHKQSVQIFALALAVLLTATLAMVIYYELKK